MKKTLLMARMDVGVGFCLIPIMVSIILISLLEQNLILYYLHNTIDYVMGEYDGRRDKYIWPNFLFRSLMANQEFKNDFINRMNDLMNSYFSEEVTSKQIDEIVQNLENEMPNQVDR